jgi:hypothetical protein
MMSEHWIFLAYVYEACVETWCSTAVKERSMMCCYLNVNLHLVFSKKINLYRFGFGINIL